MAELLQHAVTAWHVVPGAPKPFLHAVSTTASVWPCFCAQKGFCQVTDGTQTNTHRQDPDKYSQAGIPPNSQNPELHLNAEDAQVKPKARSKANPRKNRAGEASIRSSLRQLAAKDQGIAALYIVLLSLPLKITVYKYLQGNDINEGRELFSVSKDGWIYNSVLKLWKGIFRLDHA